jgi:hypothetical protein
VLPARLSLNNLSGLTGEVSVDLEITTSSPSAPRLSFAKVVVEGKTFNFQPPTSGNTFTATFASTVPLGASTLYFDISSYTYTGMKSDTATYAFNARVTYIKGGKSAQISPAPAYTFDLKKV